VVDEVVVDPTRVVVVEEPVGAVVVELVGADVVEEPAPPTVVVVVAGVCVVVDTGGAVVVVVAAGWVVVVVVASSPGMNPFGLLVVIVVTARGAGGYRTVRVPNPRKATSISTVDRRTGTARDNGSAMRPTRALWGGWARKTSPVGWGTPSASSGVGPASSTDSSGLTACASWRWSRRRAR
jgi:hypothetical protein